MEQLLKPQQNKYKKILQQNPASKVFAPLADIYRKYTMFDEALRVLQKGMLHNPDYIPGHLALARCHYDQGRFEECHTVLKPLMGASKDNLKMQRLFFQVCVDLELLDEALETVRHLRYLEPHNKEWVEQMDALEGKKGENDTVSGKRVLFSEERLSVFPRDVDEWTEHHFQDQKREADESEQSNLMEFYDKQFTPRESSTDGWEGVKKGLQHFRSAINQRAASILTRE